VVGCPIAFSVARTRLGDEVLKALGVDTAGRWESNDESDCRAQGWGFVRESLRAEHSLAARWCAFDRGCLGKAVLQGLRRSASSPAVGGNVAGSVRCASIEHGDEVDSAEAHVSPSCGAYRAAGFGRIGIGAGRRETRWFTAQRPRACRVGKRWARGGSAVLSAAGRGRPVRFFRALLASLQGRGSSPRQARRDSRSRTRTARDASSFGGRRYTKGGGEFCAVADARR